MQNMQLSDKSMFLLICANFFLQIHSITISLQIVVKMPISNKSLTKVVNSWADSFGNTGDILVSNRNLAHF